MIARALAACVEWLTARLGPWSLVGVEYLPGEIRSVRLFRTWKGWGGSQPHAELASKWVLDKATTRTGFHVAAGGVPVLFKAAIAIEEWEKHRADPPAYIGVNPLHPWPFLWRSDKLEQQLEDVNPCTVSASATLLRGMLAESGLPLQWIAVRFLQECAMVWFLEGRNLLRFLTLSGGMNDPVLLEQEWKQLMEEDLPRELPDFHDARIAILESVDPGRSSRILSGDEARLISAPLNPRFLSYPENVRFAAAAALAWQGIQVLDSNPFGWEFEFRKGRISAAKGILAGLAVLVIGGVGELALQWSITRTERRSTHIQAVLSKKAASVDAVVANERRLHDRKVRVQEFSKQGGRLADGLAKSATCLTEPSRVTSWEGDRGESGFRQKLVLRTASSTDLAALVACQNTAFHGAGLRVQATETNPANLADERLVVTIGTDGANP